MRRLRNARRSLARRLSAWTPTTIQILGMGSFATGWFLIAVPVGCIVTGLMVMAVGWALDGDR